MPIQTRRSLEEYKTANRHMMRIAAINHFTEAMNSIEIIRLPSSFANSSSQDAAIK